MSNVARRPPLHIRDLKARLIEIGCPYMTGVEESWVNELVFEVGESRDRIIRWLVEEVLGDSIEKVEFKQSESKAQTTKLTHICSCLGLCEANDNELVSGVQKTATQVQFLTRLLSMVEILKEGKCDGFVTQARELVAEMSQEDLMEVINKGDIDLIPADIKKYIELDSLAEGKQGVKIVSLLSELAVEAVNIEAEISKQTKEIETLGVSSEQANEFTDLMNKNRVECTTKIKMISSSIQSLKLLVNNFTDFYSLRHSLLPHLQPRDWNKRVPTSKQYSVD